MVLGHKHFWKGHSYHEKVTENESHAKHTFRFPRVLAMKNETDPKSEKPIRFAIKFSTKAVNTPYMYVKTSKSYKHQHTFRPFGSEKNDDDDYRKEENLMKNLSDSPLNYLQKLWGQHTCASTQAKVMSKNPFVPFSTRSFVTDNLRNVKFYLYGVFGAFVALK